MIEFLKETAQNVVKSYGENLKNICFVFPNKRTKMFFRKYYAEVIGKTDFAPDMKDLKQLVRNFTKLSEPDSLSLIFDLYDIFKKFDKGKSILSEYNFDDFYKTGEIIINDFNEIDNWLVNPLDIYKNIKNIKEIDSSFDYLSDEQKVILKSFWSTFASEIKSREQEKFIEIWNILPVLYKNFKDFLLEKNTAYNGLIYRKMVELIDENKINTDKYQKYIFIGFNALNEAEIQIFKYFKSINKAHFYWDTDKYYQKDLNQEAGDFLRKNFNILNQSEYEIPENFINKNKKIEFIGMPQSVGQAKIIPDILEKYNVKNDINNTAIILSDEQNLFPVLHSIPDYIQSINVTMGYPFKMTSLFDLINKYCKLRTDSYKKNDGIYYFNDVLTIIKHPDIMQYDSLSCEKIIEYIETKNVIYIDYNILVSSQNHVLIEIFKPLPKEKPEEALLTNILNLLFLIFKKQNQTENFEKLNIEKEYINKSYKLVKQFRETLKNRNTNLSLNLVIDLLLKILTAQQIPFAGKAEEGLQLMGVLESRNLDFKNLIVLGVNEGNLPAVSSSATFLSQSVRAAFGMPIVKHQDSVYAYLFYRMLQRAENITLIYNNVVSDTNSGEKSRFLLQLLHESGHEIIQKQFKEEILIAEKSEISVKQNETTLKILDSYIEKNGKFDKVFSPSAINTFLSCKLKYYFRYIANLKELRPVEEEISPASTGTIIHAILESIYKKLFAQKGNRIVEKEDFVFINTNIEKAVNEAFKNYYKIEENKEYVFENNMIIIKEVIIKYINTVLKFDYNYAPFEIVSMEGEKKYYTDISIKINETKQKVKIGGVIDRIDKKDSFIRVIDYKTGSNYSNAKSILDIFDSEKASKNSHIFQALFYSKTLFDNLNKPYVNIAPALFYLREMSSSYYNPFIKFDKEEVKAEYFINLLETFNEYLSLTLSSIFSSETIFDQTKDEANCRYCPFNTICNK